MVPDLYRKIFTALLEQSKAGKLDWSTGASSGEFIVDFDGDIISMEKLSGIGGSIYFHFALVDIAGEEIDGFYVYVSDQNDYGAARDIYDLARRKVLKIDEIVANIEKKLGIRKGEPNSDLPF